MLPKTTLVYDIQYVPKDDSFRTAKIGKYPSIQILCACLLFVCLFIMGLGRVSNY